MIPHDAHVLGKQIQNRACPYRFGLLGLRQSSTWGLVSTPQCRRPRNSGDSVASTRGSAGSPAAVPKFQGREVRFLDAWPAAWWNLPLPARLLVSLASSNTQYNNECSSLLLKPRAVSTYSRTAQPEIVDQARHEKQWLARQKQFFPSDLDQVSDGLINDKTGEREGVWIIRADAGTGVTNLRVFPRTSLGEQSGIALESGRTPIHKSTSREVKAGTPLSTLPSTHPSHPSHPSHVSCLLCPTTAHAARAPRAFPRKNELLPRFFTVLPLTVAQTAISDAMEASPAVLGRCKPSDCVRR